VRGRGVRGIVPLLKKVEQKQCLRKVEPNPLLKKWSKTYEEKYK
jgi:hypothetical protein